MPRLARFDGGLNRGPVSHLIQSNEAVFYQNIDHLDGRLSPVLDEELSVDPALRWGHRFTVNNVWYWSDTPKDWVEYQENLYTGNREGPSTKVVNGTENLLGIVPPTVEPLAVPTSSVVGNITEGEYTATIYAYIYGAGDFPQKTAYNYRIVNEDADGQFSSGEEVLTVITGSGDGPGGSPTSLYTMSVRLVGIEDLFALRLYREWMGEYLLVERHEIVEADGEAFSFQDTVEDITGNENIDAIQTAPDGQVDGTGISYAMTWYNNVDGTESAPVFSNEFDVVSGFVEIVQLEVSTDPQVTHKRLYRIGGPLTSYTLVVQLDNVITEYVDQALASNLPGGLLDSGTNFPPPATGMSWLTEAYAMLFAADGDRLIFTPIGEPDYWPETYYLDFPRPITGIGKTSIGLLVFSRFETWLVTGTGPLSLTQQSLSNNQGCINGDTVVNIEGGCLWASLDGICVSTGGGIKVHSRAKLNKHDFSRAINAVVHDDKYYILVLQPDLTVNAMWAFDFFYDTITTTIPGANSLIVANDKLLGHREGTLVHIFGGDELKSMFYWSPTFVGPGFTIPKLYKNFYVYSSGQINIEIWIDDIMVQQVELSEEVDNHQIKVPDDDTRGFSCFFIVSGTGIVYEITWDEGDATQ